jgi:DNA end-binding protein Ku
MPHALWTGSISFGLVSIPVGLYPATEDHTVHFHQFESGTSDRIHYARINERTGHEVPFDDIVKGFDLGDGETVLVTPEELDAAAPVRSSTIEISDFVDLADIDPIHFRSTYYLAPRGEAAAKPYKLLLAAIKKRGKAGISQFVMRNKEHLCALRADRGLLVLETMFFADEIRDPAAVVGDSLDGVRTTQRELQMAEELVDALSARWRPDAYHDTYVEDVEALLVRKQQGEEVVPSHERPPAPVIDLMAALEQSIDRTRGRRRGGGRTSPGRPGASTRGRTAMKAPIGAKPAEAATESKAPSRRRRRAS